MTGPAIVEEAGPHPGPAIGSLCTGYGGLDLAALTVYGGHLAWCADSGKAAAVIIDARFPGIPNLGDITTIDWRHLEPVDVITAGFPCQDISEAGKRAGIQKGNRSGIWVGIVAALRVLRPRLLIVENVAALRWRGLDHVLADLARAGYDAAWHCVRASDIGAPHRRERLFLIAWPHTASADPAGPRPLRSHGPRPEATPRPCPERQRHGLPPARPHDDQHQPVDWGPFEPVIRRWERILGRPAPAPTEPGRHGNPRLSPRLSEWLMGLPDGWVTATAISRAAKLRAIGNGVVPQQAAHALRVLATENPIPLPQNPNSLPRQPDDDGRPAAAATSLPFTGNATDLAKWLHYRSQGQPKQGQPTYILGGGRVAEGDHAAPPGGSSRPMRVAARRVRPSAGRLS